MVFPTDNNRLAERDVAPVVKTGVLFKHSRASIGTCKGNKVHTQVPLSLSILA